MARPTMINILSVLFSLTKKCICGGNNGSETDDRQWSSAVNIYSARRNVLYNDEQKNISLV